MIIVDEIESVVGGLELLPSIKSLWEGLNEYHSSISKDFSLSIRKRRFIERAADFEAMSRDHKFRIELLKIEKTKLIIGFCICSLSNEFIGEIESVYIESAYRGLHFGEKLMNNALKWLDENNAKVKSANIVAGNDVLKFYKKFGFKVKSYIMEQTE